ncbi:2,3-dihydroxybenzoate-AMP ligase, partial [Bacillus pseudomycoides]|nr:2,3-dihydroxybenzoate-AMP ligase [Bacillus pseudomycoides]
RTHYDYIYSLRVSAHICKLYQYRSYHAFLTVEHNYPLCSPGTRGTSYAGGRIVLACRGSADEACSLIE